MPHLPHKFKKFILNPKVIKKYSLDINEIFCNNAPSTLTELQSTLMIIVEKYGKPVNNRPALICDSRDIKMMQKILHELQGLYYKRIKVSDVTASFLEYKFSRSHVFEQIGQVKKDIEVKIVQLLRQRKEVFEAKINNLQTSTPYSYAFRKELQFSSVAGVCTSGNMDEEVVDHFAAMFNDRHPISNELPIITSNRVARRSTFVKTSVDELQKLVSATKNSMPGWDNIPVELLKVLDKDSLAIVVDIFNAVIEGNEDIPDSLKRGILLPLPKKDRIATLSDFRPIVNCVQIVLQCY